MSAIGYVLDSTDAYYNKIASQIDDNGNEKVLIGELIKDNDEIKMQFRVEYRGTEHYYGFNYIEACNVYDNLIINPQYVFEYRLIRETTSNTIHGVMLGSKSNEFFVTMDLRYHIMSLSKLKAIVELYKFTNDNELSEKIYDEITSEESICYALVVSNDVNSYKSRLMAIGIKL